MCEYCGCRDIALIGRLSEEHYQAVDALGILQRAIASQDAAAVEAACDHMAAELFDHNDSEEAGLFHELIKDEYFAPTITVLLEQHRQFRTLVERIREGDWAAFTTFEHLLREHIDREENGLFPATAVAVDGPTWEEIDRLTHDFNHVRDREHAHSEADALARGVTPAPRHDHPHDDRAASTALRDSVVPPQTPSGITLRRLTEQDAPALTALWRTAGLAPAASGTVDDPDALAAELRSLAGLHPQLILGAVTQGAEGERIVGSIIATWDGRRAWVNRLATDPSFQGQGIAGRLLGAAEDEARALGATKINLLIEADNYAVTRYYEGRGYTTDDLIFMEKHL